MSVSEYPRGKYAQIIYFTNEAMPQQNHRFSIAPNPFVLRLGSYVSISIATSINKMLSFLI